MPILNDQNSSPCDRQTQAQPLQCSNDYSVIRKWYRIHIWVVPRFLPSILHQSCSVSTVSSTTKWTMRMICQYLLSLNCLHHSERTTEEIVNSFLLAYSMTPNNTGKDKLSATQALKEYNLCAILDALWPWCCMDNDQESNMWMLHKH